MKDVDPLYYFNKIKRSFFQNVPNQNIIKNDITNLLSLYSQPNIFITSGCVKPDTPNEEHDKCTNVPNVPNM